MSYVGGYNIIDLSRFGQVSVPGNIIVTDDEMEKFLDTEKPTFVRGASIVVTATQQTMTFSGFAPKFETAGVPSIVFDIVEISKTGDNQLSFTAG